MNENRQITVPNTYWVLNIIIIIIAIISSSQFCTLSILKKSERWSLRLNLNIIK